MPYKIVNGELVAETDKNYISLSSSKRELFDALKTQVQRAEAAEARVKELEHDLEVDDWHAAFVRAEAERDELRAELNTVNMLRAGSEAAYDELRRQLSEAQRAIDVLSNTVVAQDATIKRLEQAREDVADYRAEIARLTQQLHQAKLTIDNLTSPRDDFPYEGDEMDALQREAAA